MNSKTELLSRFSDKGSTSCMYMPDLTLWYEWHDGQGTLPDAWRGLSLPEVARAMAVPIWLPVRPWRVEYSGAEVAIEEADGVRYIRSETTAGMLVARWILGPDGDWWQDEYPVKTTDDLDAALELAKARAYAVDPGDYEQAVAEVGEDGIVALEIPRRPYSDLLHEFLGWSAGLMFLAEPAVQELLAILDEKVQSLVNEVSSLPGEIVLSPDNLDGQFISPRAFKRHLADSYGRTAETLHERGKRLLVHVGGPARHLLQPLARAGVDGIEGISGPPQGNTTLAEARETTGPGITLWGGIPQDYLLKTHDKQAFEDAVRQAAMEARGDSRMILGVTDRVPADAEPGRLAAIAPLLEQAI